MNAELRTAECGQRSCVYCQERLCFVWKVLCHNENYTNMASSLTVDRIRYVFYVGQPSELDVAVKRTSD